jgi:hypothetical protein
MYMLIKAAVLFLAIIFFLPIIFFLLVGYFGKYFSLTITRDSWVARTNVKWIRGIFKKFIV